MRLFLDSADPDVWQDLMPTRAFFGITTNPLLARKAGLEYATLDWHQLAAQAAELGADELHAQVTGDPSGYGFFAQILNEAGRAAGIDTVVKVPLVRPALERFDDIAAHGGKILMTACYDASQAAIAVTLGAHYLAPYLGRIRDAGQDDIAQLQTMLTICEDGPTQVLGASIRDLDHFNAVAACGAKAITVNAELARQLVDNPSSNSAYDAFEAAAITAQ